MIAHLVGMAHGKKLPRATGGGAILEEEGYLGGAGIAWGGGLRGWEAKSYAMRMSLLRSLALMSGQKEALFNE